MSPAPPPPWPDPPPMARPPPQQPLPPARPPMARPPRGQPPPAEDSMADGGQGGPGRIDKQGRIDDINATATLQGTSHCSCLEHCFSFGDSDDSSKFLGSLSSVDGLRKYMRKAELWVHLRHKYVENIQFGQSKLGVRLRYECVFCMRRYGIKKRVACLTRTRLMSCTKCCKKTPALSARGNNVQIHLQTKGYQQQCFILLRDCLYLYYDYLCLYCMEHTDTRCTQYIATCTHKHRFFPVGCLLVLECTHELCSLD